MTRSNPIELLGFPVLYSNEIATVLVASGVEAVFVATELIILAALFPTGRLHIKPNGRDKVYLDLSTQHGSDDRHGVARLVLWLRGETQQAHRQAHHRNGNRFDYLAGNLFLGETGRNRGEGRTAQECARRAWMVQTGKNPDIMPAEIIRDTPHPPYKAVGEKAAPPVHPTLKAGPACLSDGAAGEGGVDD